DHGQRMIVAGYPLLHVLNFSRRHTFKLSGVAGFTGLRWSGAFIRLPLLVAGAARFHADGSTLKYLARVIAFAVGSRIELAFRMRLKQAGIRFDCLSVFGLVLSSRGHVRDHFGGRRGIGCVDARLEGGSSTTSMQSLVDALGIGGVVHDLFGKLY